MEIGPALPPHLSRAAESGSEEGEESIQAGPQLPGEQKTQKISENKSSEADDPRHHPDAYRYGPALPPGFQKKPRYIGPTRPERMKEKTAVQDEEEEESLIGPMPPSATDDAALRLRTKWDFESRSQAKMEQLTGKKDEKMQRESWMTELPPELSKNFGLGPRTFRARAAEVGDRSVWTDTPSDKARKGSGSKKQATKKETIERTPWESERDEKLLHQVEEHNKRSRGESLLDMHRKKIKKQQEEEKDTITERRPFDREVDLGGPKLMDPTKRKATVEKSKQLGFRFQHSSGGSSYL